VILKLFTGATSMNNFQIKNKNKNEVEVSFTSNFKVNEKFTINGLHGVLAFYRFYILGCFG
jgi:hypothetical protein